MKLYHTSSYAETLAYVSLALLIAILILTPHFLRVNGDVLIKSRFGKAVRTVGFCLLALILIFPGSMSKLDGSASNPSVETVAKHMGLHPLPGQSVSPSSPSYVWSDANKTHYDNCQVRLRSAHGVWERDRAFGMECHSYTTVRLGDDDS